jgi:hypothetical protein
MMPGELVIVNPLMPSLHREPLIANLHSSIYLHKSQKLKSKFIEKAALGMQSSKSDTISFTHALRTSNG